MSFGSGNELSHSFSDKCTQSRAPWLSVRQMGTPDAYQATVLQQRKQKPRCRIYWNRADGPSRVCTVYKKKEQSSPHRVTTLPGDLFPPAGPEQNIPQRPKQQLSMTSAPSKGETGWPLSPCQDVLITWMLRPRSCIAQQYFHSLSASRTSFSCP